LIEKITVRGVPFLTSI